ncbi:MAG: type II toxin-antitoxin system HicB family antitoxin [Truepera sp.]|nr:type II toxin-antitoxin system HicB family antitoxin [Truepera sp.]
MDIQYPVVIEGDTSGFVPDLPVIVVAGEGRDEIVRLASEAIALRLYDLERDGEEWPTPSPVESVECEEWEVVLVKPAEVNPVSLELADAIQSARLTKAEVARRLGVSRQSIHRLTDPFYFSHNMRSLHRVAEVLGLGVQVSFPKRSQGRVRPHFR